MNIVKKIILATALLPLFASAQQKDTVRVMTYNLLYYRQTTSFCTASSNSVSVKDNAMEDIFDYTLPDIFVVNEMGGGNSVNAFRLLSNAINQNGRTNYTLANPTGIGNQLVNMLYFNTDKFVLESQSVIDKDLNNNNLTRLIDLYTLRYKDSNLAIHRDTTRINVLVAHLKAAAGTINENLRADATEAVMATLDSMNATGNYLFAGDLNLYTSNEPAYQNLINYVKPGLRFFDPINIPGSWHNSAQRSFTHTQSTHTNGSCFATSGMDDRFDFILASDEVMNNTDHMRYIPNTYYALGQDGNRYNGSIISPTNNSVPSLVSTALHNMSDHLPVLMDLEVTLPATTSIAKVDAVKKLKFANPTNGILGIDLSNQKIKIKSIEILDSRGKVILSKGLITNDFVQFDLTNFSNGIYFIKTQNESYQQSVEKLIKI